MSHAFRVWDVARIKGGKYAGLVGTVTEVKTGTDRVRVKVDGVKDNEPVTVERWFSARELEANT